MDWFGAHAWAAWAAVAVVLVVVEALTVTVFMLMLAGGALAGALAALAGLGLTGQVLAAVVVSLVLTVAVRPAIVRRSARRGRAGTIGVQANVGRYAVVEQPVTAVGGRVRLDGETWSARTTDAVTLAPGQQVRVVSLDGATAVVSSAGSPAERG